MRWSERRTAVRSTFEMTSALSLRATRALVRRRSSCVSLDDERVADLLKARDAKSRICAVSVDLGVRLWPRTGECGGA